MIEEDARIESLKILKDAYDAVAKKPIAEKISATLMSRSGTDTTIAEAALVSSGRCANRPKEKNDALIKRLITEGHFSCLEHVTFAFRVKAPYRILVQMLRHRVGMSYNMASARYGFEFEDIYYPAIDEVRYRSEVAYLPIKVSLLFDQLQENAEAAFHNYKEIIAIAKAQRATYPLQYKAVLDAASYFLPQGTMGEMIVSCNLRSLAHFIGLRGRAHAQPEIQKLALDMVSALEEIHELETTVTELGLISWRV